MYHVTLPDRVESILEKGLLLGQPVGMSMSGWPEVICLTPDPNFGAVCASVNGEERVGVFWVNIRGLPINSCDPYCQEFAPVSHVTVAENIPPDRLLFLGYWDRAEIERRRLLCEGG